MGVFEEELRRLVEMRLEKSLNKQYANSSRIQIDLLVDRHLERIAREICYNFKGEYL